MDTEIEAMFIGVDHGQLRQKLAEAGAPRI